MNTAEFDALIETGWIVNKSQPLSWKKTVNYIVWKQNKRKYIYIYVCVCVCIYIYTFQTDAKKQGKIYERKSVELEERVYLSPLIWTG